MLLRPVPLTAEVATKKTTEDEGGRIVSNFETASSVYGLILEYN